MCAARLKRSREQSPDSSIDPGNISGKYKLLNIGRIQLPSIERVTNDGRVKIQLIAKRMAEVSVVTKFAISLHRDVFAFNLIKEYKVTCGEADLLTRINRFGFNNKYGELAFQQGVDGLVDVVCLRSFYWYLITCVVKLYHLTIRVPETIFGMMRLNNSTRLVPYYVIRNVRFMPLWFFNDLEPRIVQQFMFRMEGWSVAYLKFCCATIGIEREPGLFEGNSCKTIPLHALGRLDTIHIEEYWTTHEHMPDKRFNQPPDFPLDDRAILWTTPSEFTRQFRDFRVSVFEVSSTNDDH